MSKLLTVVSFSVTTDTPASLIFGLKGGATLIPASVTHEKGPKGTRLATIKQDANGQLFDLGEKVKVNGTVSMKDDVADFWNWYTNHFVMASNGGGREPEEAAPAEEGHRFVDGVVEAVAAEKAAPADAEEAVEAAAAPAFDLDAWIAGIRTRGDHGFALADAARIEEAKEALNGLKANAVKAQAKAMGVKPGTSKAKTIDAIEAHVMRIPLALASVKAAKVFLLSNSESVDDLNALKAAECGGKNRSSLVKAIDKALNALKAPAPTAPTAPTAPSVASTSGSARSSDLTDEAKAAAAELLKAIAEPLVEVVGLLGRKRAKTALTRLMMGTTDDGEIKVDIDTLLGGGADGERKSPIGHVAGQAHTVTKRHRDGRGTCTYTVTCLSGGGYKLTGLEGDRTDIKVGDTFKHGLALVQKLTGRETGIPTVWRWFNLG